MNISSIIGAAFVAFLNGLFWSWYLGDAILAPLNFVFFAIVLGGVAGYIGAVLCEVLSCLFAISWFAIFYTHDEDHDVFDKQEDDKKDGQVDQNS